MKRHWLTRGALLLVGVLIATSVAGWAFEIEHQRTSQEAMLAGQSQIQVRPVGDHYEGWMQFDSRPAYMTVAGGIGGCCPTADARDAFDLVVVLPDGKLLPPLRVEVGECHYARCVPDDKSGGDHYLLVSPEPDNYTFRAYPVSGREANPVNIYVGGVRFAFYDQHPVLRADNVWWYYPDGSREFVEDGNYSHFWATLQWGYVVMFTGFGLMAAGLVPWPRGLTRRRIREPE